MMIEAIKILLQSVLPDNDHFELFEKIENGVHSYVLLLSSRDYRKMVYSGGRIYKAVRTLLRSLHGDNSVELVMDVSQKIVD